ncbi:MAG: ABC transporter permease [Clostridium sp.]
MFSGITENCLNSYFHYLVWTWLWLQIIHRFHHVLFPIIEGVLLGLGHIPKEMYAYMQVLNADRRQIFTQLEFPCCIPYLLSSFKISILQAIIGATVAEWMAGQLGIGYLQSFASSTFDSPLLISGILFTILLGILLYAAVNLLEQRLQRYQEVKQ